MRSAVGLIVGLALSMGLVLADSGAWPDAMVLGPTAAAAVVASLIDVSERRLPDLVVGIGLGSCAAAVLLVLALGGEIESNLIAAGVGAGTFGAALLLPHLVRPAGMGFGDVKFSILLGFAVGWAAGAPIQAVVGVGWALVASSAVGLMAAASSRLRGSESVGQNGVVPFGPSLTLGSLTVALAMVVG